MKNKGTHDDEMYECALAISNPWNITGRVLPGIGSLGDLSGGGRAADDIPCVGNGRAGRAVERQIMLGECDAYCLDLNLCGLDETQTAVTWI